MPVLLLLPASIFGAGVLCGVLAVSVDAVRSRSECRPKLCRFNAGGVPGASSLIELRREAGREAGRDPGRDPASSALRWAGVLPRKLPKKGILLGWSGFSFVELTDETPDSVLDACVQLESGRSSLVWAIVR